MSNCENHTDNISESSSSDRLIQATRSPSSKSDAGIICPEATMTSARESEGANKLLIQDEASPQEAPNSLDVEANHQPKPNSFKNWVRLASMDKFDISPSGGSAGSNKSNCGSDNVQTSILSTPSSPGGGVDRLMRDDNSGTSEGTMDSPTKKSLLWKDKTKLSLPGLRKDGASTGGRSSDQGSDVTPGQRFLSAAMAVHASVRLSRMERAKRRAKWAGKKLLVFMLSHIGLILLMLLYATAGGFLFRWLERDADLQRVQANKAAAETVAQERLGPRTERQVPLLKDIDLKDIRHKYIEMMWNETVIQNILHPVNWSNSVSVIMKQFEAKVYQAVVDVVGNGSSGATLGASGLKGSEVEEVEDKWTIPASLLFSTTVITSIGYGDVTPKTMAGKLVCIPFAIVGIPLTLITLANIGQLMAGCCRFAWRRISNCGKMCRSDRDRELGKDREQNGKTRVPISVSLCIMLAYILLGALIFSSWEKGWTFLDGFYFSFVTLSTIGFGDLVPGQYEKSSNERRVVCVLYLLMGLALLSMVFQLMIDSVLELVEMCARFMGLSNEQLKEEIQGIDDTENPVPNLVLPVNNHNNQATKASHTPSPSSKGSSPTKEKKAGKSKHDKKAEKRKDVATQFA